MSADHIAYRIERYLKQGWNDAEAKVLSTTLDKDGIPVYWDDVRKKLEKASHADVLEDVLLRAFRPNYVLEYDEPGPLGSVEDGA